jgi:hypothetical protein
MAIAFDYNTQRNHLIIPEYGRYVQRMVEHCLEEEDKEKRTRMARAIVQTIGKLNPQLRSNENSDRTFWDHVHVMAGFALDVESPYPVPTAEGLKSKPEPVRLSKDRDPLWALRQAGGAHDRAVRSHGGRPGKSRLHLDDRQPNEEAVPYLGTATA